MHSTIIWFEKHCQIFSFRYYVISDLFDTFVTTFFVDLFMYTPKQQMNLQIWRLYVTRTLSDTKAAIYTHKSETTSTPVKLNGSPPGL